MPQETFKVAICDLNTFSDAIWRIPVGVPKAQNVDDPVRGGDAINDPVASFKNEDLACLREDCSADGAASVRSGWRGKLRFRCVDEISDVLLAAIGFLLVEPVIVDFVQIAQSRVGQANLLRRRVHFWVSNSRASARGRSRPFRTSSSAAAMSRSSRASS